MSRLRRLSPRAEKSIRLLVTCLIAAPLGIISVAEDNEPLGYVAVGVVLAGIVAGPLAARMLVAGGNEKER